MPPTRGSLCQSNPDVSRSMMMSSTPSRDGGTGGRQSCREDSGMSIESKRDMRSVVAYFCTEPPSFILTRFFPPVPELLYRSFYFDNSRRDSRRANAREFPRLDPRADVRVVPPQPGGEVSDVRAPPL